MNGKLRCLGYMFLNKRMYDFRLDYINFTECHKIFIVYLVDGEGRFSYNSHNGHAIAFTWENR